MHPRRVVVVEADPIASSIVGDRVTRMGMELTVLDDGVDAVAYLAGHPSGPRRPPPALVVLDLDLPTADGFEVLVWMSKSRLMRTVPVIVLSDSHRQADEERALELGASLYLRKPVDAPTLVTSVSVLLQPAEAAQP